MVEFTFHSFLGKELPEIIIKKNMYPATAEMTPFVQLQNKAYEQTHGKQMARKVAKELKAAWKERNTSDGRRTICTNVRCGAVEPEGEKFKACTRCRESGLRTTFYCSKSVRVLEVVSRSALTDLN